MTNRKLSRPVFLSLWLVLVAAFVIVIVTGAPVILIALIALANLALLPFMPRRERRREQPG
jgi:Flp pilus assembly protein TadB